MISLNTALKNWILGGSSSGSLAGAMNGGKIYIFGGTVPASADVAATGAALLATLTNNGDGSTGLTFASPANGVLPKNGVEVWECAAANTTSGTATFYRFCGPADTATTAAGTPALCIQGTIGTNSSFDMTVASVGLNGSTQFGPVTVFEIAL